MSHINILSQDTIDKIAAGEVIDRPSSIVKEMMENSIDAKSSAITVEIKDGGTSLIRITDNGMGIEKDDVKNAFLRHATSKINSVEDLLSATSLGFRGEALSSIAAVTMLECISKPKNALVGSRYVIEGGEEKEFQEVGAPSGTTFIVKNLFYNTPVRRKFLKSNTTEANYISNIVNRLALSHPEVSIRFINNNQNKLHTSGNGKLKEIIYTIYGRDIASNLLEVNESALGMKVTGFIGKPIIYKGNKKDMTYFINGRYIKSSIIDSAIMEAYKPFLMQHNFPFTVLHFEIDPEMIDVNVHPSKMEIRFENNNDIFNIFKSAISSALENKELIHEVSPDDKDVYIQDIPRDDKEIQEIINESLIPSLDTFNKQDKVSDNKESDYSYKNEKMPEPFETVREWVAPVVDFQATQETKAVQQDLFKDNFISDEGRKKHKIIGVIFDTYWLVEYEQNLYIIDQHAAHEKVLYEKTMNHLKNKTLTSQQLNPPIILTLTDDQIQVVEKFYDEFKKLGYELEQFGGNDYAVRAVPDNLYSIGKKELLLDLIDSVTETSTSLNSDLIRDRIATMSCKAAVKGHDKLSFLEANALIDELLTLENPYNCPHGRPTIISMSKYEIEKKFKRIV